MNVVVVTHMIVQAKSLVNEINSMNLAGGCIAISCIEDSLVEQHPRVYKEMYEEYGSVDIVIYSNYI
jgi:uncharacterized Zn-finger protein